MGTSDRTAEPACRAWVACLGYTLLFGVAAWPWLREAATAVPYGYGNRPDERLIAYILAWGAHVLGTDPSLLYAMPINHPAPMQLTGSEHLLSTQLVFAPVFWWTGNAVLATGVATFVAYPLGATAMYWLACLLGCDRMVAFAAGLALTLGSGQLPAHFHLLQTLVLYLPLVAATITRLRTRPTAWRALVASAACLLAFFSSYYTAVLAGFVAGLWILAEACRPLARRGRFVVLASVAVLAAGILLALFSVPYAQRPEAATEISPAGGPVYDAGILKLARYYSASSGTVLRVLAAAGLIGLAARGPARTLACRGLLFAVVGAALMLGPSQSIGGVTVPLPFGWLAATPLKFVRYPWRFLGLVVFGRALLMAGGLSAAMRWLPRPLGTLLVLASTVAIVEQRAPTVAGKRLDTITAVQLPIYDAVAQKAQEMGAGPLLEMPVLLQLEWKRLTEGDTMVGATRHWLPLVTGHTGFWPPHRPLVQALIRQLPDGEAAQTLVDVTHVRWLLLRPPAQWPPSLDRQRERLLHASWARRVVTRDGWVLMRVILEPRHEEFFTAIASGWRPGSTALGTPVRPIAAADARAVVTGRLPSTFPAKGPHWMEVTVGNAGDAAWPVTVPTFAPLFNAPYDGEVFLQATWRSLDDPSRPPIVVPLQLRRDVAAGELLAQPVMLPRPDTPGRYAIEIAVRQRNGEGFAEPLSRALRGEIEVP